MMSADIDLLTSFNDPLQQEGVDSQTESSVRADFQVETVEASMGDVKCRCTCIVPTFNALPNFISVLSSTRVLCA